MFQNAVELITMTSAISAVVIGWLNTRKIKSVDRNVEVVHKAINSRMTELLRLTGVAARAEGVAERIETKGK